MKYIMLGLYPFIGTTIGSMFVFFVKDKLNHNIEKMMLSIASGVMLASAFFSLLIPSIELSKSLNNFMFIPPILGFGLGFIVFIIFDHFVVNKNKDKIMMPLVVTLHNIPEGMAVGVSIASLLIDKNIISYSSVLALSIGIAIQNIPEGAIISLTLKSQGIKKFKAFLIGVASGIVEPIASLLTIIFTNIMSFILPYSLSFASSAMIYVIIEELLPGAYDKESKRSILSFLIGFIIMMFLDIMLSWLTTNFKSAIL